MNKALPTLVLLLLVTPVGAAETPKKNFFTTAAGFPHFFSAQYSRQLDGRLAVGLAAGRSAIPVVTKSCGARVTMGGANLEAVSRYRLGDGAFFGGFNAGYQDFKVESKQRSIPGSDYDITDGVKVFYVTPHLGWFKAYKSGWVIGTEFGLRLPVSTRRYTERSGPGDYTPEVRKAVDDGLELLAKRPLPFLSLLRLGYAF